MIPNNYLPASLAGRATAFDRFAPSPSMPSSPSQLQPPPPPPSSRFQMKHHHHPQQQQQPIRAMPNFEGYPHPLDREDWAYPQQPLPRRGDPFSRPQFPPAAAHYPEPRAWLHPPPPRDLRAGAELAPADGEEDFVTDAAGVGRVQALRKGWSAAPPGMLDSYRRIPPADLPASSAPERLARAPPPPLSRNRVDSGSATRTAAASKSGADLTDRRARNGLSPQEEHQGGDSDVKYDPERSPSNRSIVSITLDECDASTQQRPPARQGVNDHVPGPQYDRQERQRYASDLRGAAGPPHQSHSQEELHYEPWTQQPRHHHLEGVTQTRFGLAPQAPLAPSTASAPGHPPLSDFDSRRGSFAQQSERSSGFSEASVRSAPNRHHYPLYPPNT
ncbi:hypothetical protein DFJ73DRAFT_436041 [Zopfochytrium polystomum]|nr:hypothetical protein DFJ73DRAFT_436041 [Zopfochytrium polystomum]